jgi:hypothetical protein
MTSIDGIKSLQNQIQQLAIHDEACLQGRQTILNESNTLMHYVEQDKTEKFMLEKEQELEEVKVAHETVKGVEATLQQDIEKQRDVLAKVQARKF